MQLNHMKASNFLLLEAPYLYRPIKKQPLSNNLNKNLVNNQRNRKFKSQNPFISPVTVTITPINNQITVPLVNPRIVVSKNPRFLINSPSPSSSPSAMTRSFHLRYGIKNQSAFKSVNLSSHSKHQSSKHSSINLKEKKRSISKQSKN
jgi:hypothetical protein